MKSKLSLFLQLLNLLILGAAAGYLYYIKIVYKRPVITEESEKIRLAEALTKAPTPETPSLINFAPVTLNILPTGGKAKATTANGPVAEGKLHYATVGFAVKIRDKNKQATIEELKPFILDKLVSVIGKKSFHELTTVQGRYILASDLVTAINKIVTEHAVTPPESELVSDVYFNEFIVQ